MGILNKIFAPFALKGGKPDQPTIDAPHIKAHHTAADLLKKWLYPDKSGTPKAA